MVLRSTGLLPTGQPLGVSGFFGSHWRAIVLGSGVFSVNCGVYRAETWG